MNKKIFIYLFIIISLLFIDKISAINFSYSSHIQDIGWQKYVNLGETSGTTGKSKRLESFKIDFTENEYKGNIEYSSFVEKKGWQDYVKNNEISGTTGQNKKIKAIKIRLTEELEEKYDIYYRVHVSNYGWLGWSKNDEKSGVIGDNNQVEAIQIKIVSKDSKVDLSTKNNFISKEPTITYSSHIQDIGWQKYVNLGETSGTTGKSKRLESFKIDFTENEYKGNIEYSSFVEKKGWQDYVKNNEISGTTGQNKKIKAIKIRLTEELEEKYDIYYRVHVSNYGWLGWSKNDEKSGVIGDNNQVEAIQIKIVSKDSKVDLSTKNNFISKEPTITYSSHIQDIGWQKYVNLGETSGTTGKSKRLESFKIDFTENEYKGNIEYSSFVEKKGWQDYVKNNEISGTTGQNKKIKAIKIRLTEELEEKYDIYYRVHVSNYGWLGWSKNDEKSGVIGDNNQVEAIQIKIVSKDSKVDLSTKNNFISKEPTITYSSHIQDIGWQDYINDGEISGTTGKSKKIDFIKIKLNETEIKGDIKYTTYIRSLGWQDYVTSDNVTGYNNRKIEAIKINLTEELKEKYDIYYRVHVSNYGWLGWVSNDQETGVIGYNEQIEAYQIKLIKKGTNFSDENNSNNTFYKNNNYITYSSHVQDIGWQDYVGNDEVSGVQNHSKRLEAFLINLNNQTLDGNIEYSTHVQDIGWQGYVKNNNIAGTVGLGKRIEALKIRLTGKLSEVYDIYYRAYIQNYGWLSWTKNDQIAGSTGLGLRLEAIQIKLVDKNEMDNFQGASYITGGFLNMNNKTYFIKNDGNKATGFLTLGENKYFFNSYGELLFSNVEKIIDISKFQNDIDWNMLSKSDVDGTIIRMGYGTIDEGPATLDPKFVEYLNEARHRNLLKGIYLYSYALNEISAGVEADFVISYLKRFNVSKSIPIYYDLESNKFTQNLSSSEYDRIINTFITKLKNEGYTVKLYTYKYLAETKFSDYARSNLNWIAQYHEYCTYTGNFTGWQYTSTGSVNGVFGNVDISVFKK